MRREGCAHFDVEEAIRAGKGPSSTSADTTTSPHANKGSKGTKWLRWVVERVAMLMWLSSGRPQMRRLGVLGERGDDRWQQHSDAGQERREPLAEDSTYGSSLVRNCGGHC